MEHVETTSNPKKRKVVSEKVDDIRQQEWKKGKKDSRDISTVLPLARELKARKVQKIIGPILHQ